MSRPDRGKKTVLNRTSGLKITGPVRFTISTVFLRRPTIQISSKRSDYTYILFVRSIIEIEIDENHNLDDFGWVSERRQKGAKKSGEIGILASRGKNDKAHYKTIVLEIKGDISLCRTKLRLISNFLLFSKIYQTRTS